MPLPYATPQQLNNLETRVNQKIDDIEVSSGNITKVSQLQNDAGYITDAALADYALISQIPDVSNLATQAEVQEVESKIPTDYVASSELENYALKTNIPDTTNLATKEEVNEISQEVTNIESNYVSNSTLESTLGDYAKTSDIPDVSVYVPNTRTVANKSLAEDITLASTDLEDSSDIVRQADILRMPLICTMPFRVLQDRVYSQEEIFEWFGVSSLAELKTAIIRKPVFITYGITLSSLPMYYYIPCQNIQFESANTLVMRTDGLNTKDDVFSRYKITINLDGSIVSGNSNIEVDVQEIYALKSEIPNIPELPEDSSTKTYTLKSVNGELTWVEG